MGKVSGLSWIKTADKIHEFVNRHGREAPRRAILCTFDFNQQRFEDKIQTELTRAGKPFRTLVLVDAGELRKQLTCAGPRFQGYQVAPVRCRGSAVFHAKLIFLSAGSHHLVGIGSSNLTPGGLGSNLELMYFADDSDLSGQALVGGATHFLGELSKTTTVNLPQSARAFIRRSCLDITPREGVIIDSLGRPLVDQMVEACRGAGLKTIKTLSVLSPWHSGTNTQDQGDRGVLNRLQRDFSLRGKERIHLYTEGRSRRRGPRLPGIQVHVRRLDDLSGGADAGDGDDSAFDRIPARVHAKAYLARSSRDGVFFFGSANCTMPALVRSARKGGNVEILAATRLGKPDMPFLQNDLKDLFCPATSDGYETHPKRRRDEPCGNVLAAEFVRRKDYWELRLEAPGILRQKLFITGGDGIRFIPVWIRRGVGIVARDNALRLLRETFPESRADDWQPEVCCGVLYERIVNRSLPFPVSFPIIRPMEDEDPCTALESMLLEEMGRLRPCSRRGDSSATTPESVSASDHEEADDILAALAETHHQGELDRLAVRVAGLKKFLVRSKLGSRYIRQRTELFRQQISSMKQIRPHILREILRYLNFASIAAVGSPRNETQ